MKWTQERLAYLAEVNKEKKIPRYFSIKKLVETIVEEHTETAMDWFSVTPKYRTKDKLKEMLNA